MSQEEAQEEGAGAINPSPPSPALLPGPHWPFAALKAGEQRAQGRARIKKEAMWWVHGPWRLHSCQLHVTAAAQARGVPAPQTGLGPAAPAGSVHSLAVSGVPQAQTRQQMRQRRRNRLPTPIPKWFHIWLGCVPPAPSPCKVTPGQLLPRAPRTSYGWQEATSVLASPQTEI